MRCAESLRVQAYFDGELDALSAADVERHCEACAECRERLEDLEQLRTALRQELTYAVTPPPLRARIMRALDRESTVQRPRLDAGRLMRWRPRPFWQGAFSGIAGTAIVAAIALLLLAPPLSNPLLDELVSAHVRSLMPEHLIDVESTDKHTVKPWFAGHTDVSPVVADFPRARLSAHWRACGLFLSPTRSGGRVSAWFARHQRVQLGRNERELAQEHHPQWLSFGLLEAREISPIAPSRMRVGRSSRVGTAAAGSWRPRYSRLAME